MQNVSTLPYSSVCGLKWQQEERVSWRCSHPRVRYAVLEGPVRAHAAEHCDGPMFIEDLVAKSCIRLIKYGNPMRFQCLGCGVQTLGIEVRVDTATMLKCRREVSAFGHQD